MPTKEQIFNLFEPIDHKLSKDESNGLISFSLYGVHSLYCDGAIENIPLAQHHYPEWNLRFYVSEDCPILPRLWKEDVDIFVMKKPKGSLGMFWRLLDITSCTHDYVLIRDTDQRLSDKESKAVDAWIKSDTLCHRMHEDSSQTSLELMGCAIGFKTSCMSDIMDHMASWMIEKSGHEVTYESKIIGGADDFPKLLYGADQVFLTDKVWPNVRESCTTHGILGDPFPMWNNYLPWGGDAMFRRIVPHTNNSVIFGARPSYAYESENH
jgi:hypothetical protein